MQKAILSCKELNIKQMMNEKFSHDGDLAIDISSKCKYLKAPFDLVIKRIYTPCNAVFCESVDKVLYSDGTVDFMSLLLIHDDDVSDLKVGEVLNQGTIFYQPGNKGKSTGSHIHIAIGRGKYQKWIKGKYQPKVKCYAWILPNQYPINKGLYLDSGVKVTKGIYDWKIITNKPSDKIYAKKCDSTYKSLVDALISVNIKADFKSRTKIAKLNGIGEYHGKSKDNIYLLNLLKKGLLIIG